MSEYARLLDQIHDLPTLPDVVARVNRMLADPKTSASDINATLSRDMALSTKILRLVNSPFYGFPRRITTITYAVVILGFNKIRDLALSAFVFDAFQFRNVPLDLRQFWRHALGAATVAQTLAKLEGERHEDDAFMAGLLHDVGKAVLAQFMPKEFSAALERAKRENRLLRDTEYELLGYDHADIGGALMERWNLPASLVAAVAYHHRPRQAPEDHAHLVGITHLGDIVARALLFGDPGDDGIPALCPEVWKASGLSWETLEKQVPKIVEQMARSDQFYR